MQLSHLAKPEATLSSEIKTTKRSNFYKVISFLLFLMLYCTINAGAITYVDTPLIAPAPTDTLAYINYLNKLSSDVTETGNRKQALQYSEQALLLARQTGNQEAEAITTINIGHAYAREGNNRKAISSFIHALNLQKIFKDSRRSEKLYYHMAIAFARAKKYPLALKYFHKSIAQSEKKDRGQKVQHPADEPADPDAVGWVQHDELEEDKDSLGTFALYDDFIELAKDGNLIVNGDTLLLGAGAQGNIAPVSPEDIVAPFADGKTAIAYGLVIHTKQPQMGKRKTFTGINNVGHMFITLTKFNTDSGYVSRTFGFYPQKDYLLSATPFLPVSSSVFKNDESKDWDEIVGKFISRRRFKRILRMVKQYSRTKYNLNKNNCTDFGLCVAAVAGIKINHTKGTWPLGGGNNPADAGQSILEGKLEQLDDREEIFIISNAPIHP